MPDADREGFDPKEAYQAGMEEGANFGGGFSLSGIPGAATSSCFRRMVPPASNARRFTISSPRSTSARATDWPVRRAISTARKTAEAQLDIKHGADIPSRKFGRMWVARDDARNFMIPGDPAVRLRVEDLAGGASRVK